MKTVILVIACSLFGLAGFMMQPANAISSGFELMPDFKCPNVWPSISYVYGFKNGVPMCGSLQVMANGPGLSGSTYTDDQGHTYVDIHLDEKATFTAPESTTKK